MEGLEKGFRLGFGFFLIHAFALELGHQFFHFRFIMLVEGNIVIANQVISLLAGKKMALYGQTSRVRGWTTSYCCVRTVHPST